MFRNSLRIAASAVLLTGLAACATTGSNSYSADKRVEAATYRVDEQRIMLIEREARRRGVDVHWVNKPRMTDSNGS